MNKAPTRPPADLDARGLWSHLNHLCRLRDTTDRELEVARLSLDGGPSKRPETRRHLRTLQARRERIGFEIDRAARRLGRIGETRP